MIEVHDPVQVYLETDQNFVARLIRHLASDQMYPSITCVVEGNLAPDEYAEKIADTYGTALARQFMDARVPLPDDVLVDWTFEYALRAALFYRMFHLTKEERSAQTFVAWLMVTILGSDESALKGQRAGLLSLVDDLYYLAEFGGLLWAQDRNHRLYQTIQGLSRFSESSWICRLPAWEKALQKREDAVDILKSFLHCAFVVHITNPQIVEEVLATTVDEMMYNIKCFNRLIADDTTTVQDVLEFLDDMSSLLSPTLRVDLAKFAHAPFVEASEEYQQTYGHTRRTVSSTTLVDSPIQAYLRSKGDVLNPDQVLAEGSPLHLAHHAIAKDLKGLYANIYRAALDKHGIQTREDLPRKVHYIQGHLYDLLVCDLLERRLSHQFETPEQAEAYVLAHSQILLLVPDNPKVGIGLSLVSKLLKMNLEIFSSYFSQDEQKIFGELISAWGAIRLHKPQSIRPAWKEILRDVELLSAIRWAFYIIIEMMHLQDQDEYTAVTDSSRTVYFAFLKTFADHLRGDPDKGEFASFLENFPRLSRSVVTTSADPYLISGTYGEVNLQETEFLTFHE